MLVEKPLDAVAVAHGRDDLAKLVEQNGVAHGRSHLLFYSNPMPNMKELIESGELGELYYIGQRPHQPRPVPARVNVVWDLGDSRPFDRRVSRRSSAGGASRPGAAHADPGIEDIAYLNVDYGERLMANFHVNWLSPVKVRQMIVGGGERSLIQRARRPSRSRSTIAGSRSARTEQRRKTLISYRSGDVWSPNLATREPLSRMAEHFVTCVKTGQRPVTDGKSGLRIVKILDAAQRGIKSANGRVNI